MAVISIYLLIPSSIMLTFGDISALCATAISSKYEGLAGIFISLYIKPDLGQLAGVLHESIKVLSTRWAIYNHSVKHEYKIIVAMLQALILLKGDDVVVTFTMAAPETSSSSSSISSSSSSSSSSARAKEAAQLALFARNYPDMDSFLQIMQPSPEEIAKFSDNLRNIINSYDY